MQIQLDWVGWMALTYWTQQVSGRGLITVCFLEFGVCTSIDDMHGTSPSARQSLKH